MSTVATWRPTRFDRPLSVFLPERTDWTVEAVYPWRPGQPLRKARGPNEEVHGFSHWGSSGFQVRIRRPHSLAASPQG